MKVLGIMSGTSLGGCDFVLCDIDGEKIRRIDHWNRSYPNTLNRSLQLAAAGKATSHQVGQWHHDLGRFYAKAAMSGLTKGKVELAGLHGQTIFHGADSPAPATFQLGEPSYLAAALKCPVVSNFRAADLAVGGQGAPLATSFHCQVFGRRGQHVCVNNLGGISNVTSIDWRRGARASVLAFDTGPANMLLDLAVQKLSGGKKTCDRGGTWASRGQVDQASLQRWLRHPFYRRPPPKSTGREEFGEIYFEKLLGFAKRRRHPPEDFLATLTELTAQSLFLNYRLHLPELPDRLILSGGGSRNRFLAERIAAVFREARARTEVTTSDQSGWPAETVEGAAFAWLAVLRLSRRPGNLPETTGARKPVLLGSITRVM